MTFFMIFPYNFFWLDYYLYYDLIKDDRVSYYCVNKPIDNNVINILRRVHLSNRVNKVVDLPGKDYWNIKILNGIEKDTCVIITTGDLAVISEKLLKKIKKKAGKLVLIIVDSMHANSVHMKNVIPIILSFDWDLVLSYDIKDCLEYGFNYLGENYYSVVSDIVPSLKKSDIYYIGSNKANRDEYIIRLQEIMINNNIKCNFNLINTKSDMEEYNKLKNNGLTVSRVNVPYKRVLSEVMGSNCILEVLQKGQKTQSIRYFEAVCYNKKLLTNKFTIKNVF